MYQSTINAASALQKQVYETPQNKSEKTQNTQPSFSSNEGFRGYSVEVLSPPPSHFLCPITQDLMTEPVSVSCGHTFERSAIADWVKARKHNCPSCNQSININPNTWAPNWGIKSGIEEWKQKNEEPVVPLTLSDSQSTLDLDKSDLLLKMAELHLKRDDFGKAVESYEEALQSTDSIETYLAYANLLEKAHSPKARKAFLYLGRLYGKENKGERAIEAYQKASALDPENRTFLEEFAQCLEHCNKRAEAAECYEKLIQILTEKGNRAAVKEIKEKLKNVQGTSWESENAVLKQKVAKLKERLAEMEKRMIRLEEQEEKRKREESESLRSLLDPLPQHVRMVVETILRNESSQMTLEVTSHMLDEKLNDEMVKAIAYALEKNTTLQVLRLNDNQIENRGARFLAKALKVNQSLTELNLDGNKIGINGIDFLLKALTINHSLKTLSLYDNQSLNTISKHKVREWLSLLRNGLHVEFLHLCRTSVHLSTISVLEGISRIHWGLREQYQNNQAIESFVTTLDASGTGFPSFESTL